MDKLIATEYGEVDKSTWQHGPWDTEPDKLHWIDEASDLDCMILRGPAGALCGYVGIDESHPLFGVPYGGARGYMERQPDDIIPEDLFDVHGGLTYSDVCDEGGHICHVPARGRSEHVWWYGFDCAHAFDYCPKFEATTRHLGLTSFTRGTYRDVNYVQAECASLARQLSEYAMRHRVERGLLLAPGTLGLVPFPAQEEA
jgi:hypothetical protein